MAKQKPKAGFSFDYDFWLRNGCLAQTIDIRERQASQGPGIPAPGNGN